MIAALFILLIVGLFWAVNAPTGHHDTPTDDELLARQRQVDAATNMEIL